LFSFLKREVAPVPPEPKAQARPAPERHTPAPRTTLQPRPRAVADGHGVTAGPATGGIAYDPHLVTKLKGDHQDMLALYTRLLNAAETGRPESLHGDLILFRRIFQGHILMESVRFYVYLDRLLAEHPSVRDEARAVRKDMNAIAKAVADFIHVWISSPIKVQALPQFMTDLKGIGAALVARVELEESSLYTLYTETL
jgi:FAD/FMN-containing dehydrogenase